MMKKKNAILFSNVDREDYWVCGGLVFKVKNTNTYLESYNEIKSKLETEEVINYILNDVSAIFNGDESFKFVETYWRYGLYFVFKNSEGEEHEYNMSADYVTLF